MSDPFIAEVIMFAGNFAPRGWTFCHGQLLAISSYSAVFSLVGTTFGGDGRTTFGIPDLRGRVPVGVGSGPGLQNVTWGQKSGTNTNTLIANNLPAHTHPLQKNTIDEDGNLAEPANNFLAEKAGNYHAGPGTGTSQPNVTANNTTANMPVNNMQPYLGLYYIFALVGVFPSRN